MKRLIWAALKSASTITGIAICLICTQKLERSVTRCVVS